MKILNIVGCVATFLLVTTKISGQNLQITEPDCLTQYSIPGTCDIPCTCPWEIDASAVPCSTLSFGGVEVGLTRIKQVKIKNSGGVSALKVIVSLAPSPLGDNKDHWQIVEDLDGDGSFQLTDIPVGNESVVNIKFRPQITASAGGLPEYLLVTSSNSDLCYRDVDSGNNTPGNKLDVLVGLSGTATRTSNNYVMVFDRSGSMDWTYGNQPGNPKRIELLKIAANYFVDLVVTRNNTADKLGMIEFDDVALPALMSLATFNEASARTSIASLTPRYGTGIGQALIEADNLYTSMTDKNSLLLFTDGEENIPPWISSATFVNNPKIYSIGLGTVNQNALQTLSNNNRGKYYLVPPTIPSSSIPIDLQKSYLDIFTDISDMEMVVDPVYQVNVTNTDKVVTSSLITSSDRSAIFSVFDSPEKRKGYEIAIQSPKGEWVTNGTLASGISGSITSHYNYTIFSVNFLNVTDPTSYVGEWKLVLKAKTSEPYSAVVPIGFASVVFSDLKMNVDLGALNYVPGNDINVAIVANESGIAIDPTKIVVKLTDPLGNETTLNTQKDAFGKWITHFPHTYHGGTYQVFVRATIKNSKGELTTREETKFIALNHPTSNPMPVIENCFSCNMSKVIIGLIVVLLIILIGVIFWAKRRV